MAHRGPPAEADREVYESVPDATFGQGNVAVGSSTDVGGQRFGARARFSEDVDDESQEANVAYEFFKGKTFKAINYEEGFPIGTAARDMKGRTEFEILGGRSTKFHGGVTRTATMRHMESLAAGAKYQNFETPVQRLTRLQGEVEEMQEVVHSFLASRNIEECDETNRQAVLREAKRYFEADPTKLFAELQNLQKQLEGVLADERLQNFFTSTEPTTGRRSQYEVVVKHLDEVTTTLKTTDASTGSAIAKPPKKTQAEGAAMEKVEDGSTFSYELYCVPSMKPLIEGSRLRTLEKRLSDLEAHIGVNMRRPVTMPFEDLSAGLSEVASRLVQLDSSRLDALGQRMTKLNNELDALQRRRERLTGSTSNVEDQHVQQLYEISDRWRHATAALPLVIRRLKTLKALHQESASVSTRLNVLESQQNDLAKLLETTAVNFDTLRDTIAVNMQWAKNMVSELHDRVHTLQLVG